MIAYLGDDMVDLLFMELVGLPIIANSTPEILKVPGITKVKGGEGAFREAGI